MGAIEKAIARFNVATDSEKAQSEKVQPNAANVAAANLAAAQAGAAQHVAPPVPADVRPPRPLPAVANPSVQLVKGGGFRAEDEVETKRFKLPYKAMELEGLLSLTAPRNQMSEEYRAIKRPVLAAIDAQDRTNIDDLAASRNVVMVTSCVSGEGKTFSAINLALSIAMERDREVLLVDGDITNPSCGKRLGFDNDQPGLTELLQNNNRDPDKLIWHCLLYTSPSPRDRG